MFLFVLAMLTNPLCEYRQFVSAKLRLTAFNRRMRFVRFEYYMKYSGQSSEFGKII